jgi:hypothetical protein
MEAPIHMRGMSHGVISESVKRDECVVVCQLRLTNGDNYAVSFPFSCKLVSFFSQYYNMNRLL